VTAALDTHRSSSRGPNRDLVLTLSCPDRPGIVFAVSKFLVEHGCNIVESHQFDERDERRLFMRVQFESVVADMLDIDVLRADFEPIAAQFSMNFALTASAHRQRILILVSKFGHCLNDLLFRTANGSLHIDVVAVVSNHPDLAELADNYRIPFHHIPVTRETKAQAEQKLLALIDELDVELVVLARYMQILSTELCRTLEGRAINIHHSMLPSFKGARPYHQAYDRGVKLIGATAHYVTTDLDEGPIIEQQVARVDHSMTAEDVTELGRETECLALARAVAWHTDNRVLLHGHRTVVFA
jgi:formyltetrahydrofolate deformylase